MLPTGGPHPVFAGERHLGDPRHRHALGGQQDHLGSPPGHHRPGATADDPQQPSALVIVDLAYTYSLGHYRGGRPKTFTLPERREIKKIAKSRPAEHDLPFSTWSLTKLADPPLHRLAKPPRRRPAPTRRRQQGKR
ncbi:hypothetical protein RKD26_006781 [Streptomyces calvus]